MNITIIEDELRAYKQLEQMLTEVPMEMNIIAHLESVDESVDWFQNNEHPDLIFMDIQLADGLSFEILKVVEINVPIIFTTAFDQYAIKAFKYSSIDYLMKPFHQDELNAALDKFQKQKNKESAVIDQLTIEKLMNNLIKSKGKKRFIVKEGNSMTFVQVEDILYFYSEDSISFIMTKTKKRYIIDMSLDAIEDDLDPAHFFRINRKQIIQINSIDKIHPYFNHRLKLDINGWSDLEFIVSRKRMKEFNVWLRNS